MTETIQRALKLGPNLGVLILFGLCALFIGADEAAAKETVNPDGPSLTFPVSGTEWTPPSPSFRVIVTEDGIYQLTYAALEAAGLPVDTIDPNQFGLFWMGESVDILLDGDGDSTFEAGESVLFYGRGVDSLFQDGLLAEKKYTGENVYFLHYSGGSRMTARAGDGSGGVAVTTYRHHEHFESNRFYFSELPFTLGEPFPERFHPGSDRWYWFFVRSDANPPRPPVPVSNIPASGADVSVRMQFVGSIGKTLLSVPDIQHHIQMEINGTSFYDNPDAGRNRGIFTVEGTFPHSELVEGSNRLLVRLISTAFDEVYANWYQVSYDDTLTAENEVLLFDGQAGSGSWDYTVSGFNDGAIWVFDVTNLMKPQLINSASVSAGPPFSTSFSEGDGGRKYAAVSRNGLLSPVRIEPIDYSTSGYSPADLLDTSNRAEWIAIAPTELWSESVRLAQYRAEQYTVALIDVQQIYDQFNGGLESAESIREFLRYAYTNWSGATPRFVLLFGDGTRDMRNYVSQQVPTYIPPFLVVADYTLGETAADNRFVTIVGDDLLPDISIGRFPVDTLEEAKIMVDKTINYETTPTADDWNKNILMIADDQDDLGGNFYEFSDILADGYVDPDNPTPETKFLPDPYQATKVYLGDTCDPDNVGNNDEPVECRNQIVQSVNSGALFTSYVGHAQRSNWALEPLVDSSLVSQFNNQDRLSIFLGMACFEGFFHEPDLAPLAEQYLLNPNGGAVASWSPTGFGVATGHDWLEQGLFLEVFQKQNLILGEAADAAKRYMDENAPRNLDGVMKYEDLLDTFLIFGDPALRIQAFVSPTAVSVVSFNGVYGQTEVKLTWETVSENAIAGFNVLRGPSAQGPFERINDTIIQASRSGSAEGASYQFSAVPSTTDSWYAIDIIRTDGSRERQEAIQVLPPRIDDSLYLPAVVR